MATGELKVVKRKRVTRPLLGDRVTEVLASAGITEERARKYLGVCGCAQRRQWLNDLDAFIQAIISGEK